MAVFLKIARIDPAGVLTVARCRVPIEIDIISTWKERNVGIDSDSIRFVTVDDVWMAVEEFPPAMSCRTDRYPELRSLFRDWILTTFWTTRPSVDSRRRAGR